MTVAEAAVGAATEDGVEGSEVTFGEDTAEPWPVFTPPSLGVGGWLEAGEAGTECDALDAGEGAVAAEEGATAITGLVVILRGGTLLVGVGAWDPGVPGRLPVCPDGAFAG